RVVEDSSGNAGASIAAYCANAGMGCDIYSLTSIAPRKEQQITAFGARLHKVAGDREVMSAAAQKAAARSFYASHIWNPFFIEGTMTVAYEISEALGWKAPDVVFIPTSAGTLLLGAIKGFEHLREADVIEHTPLVVAVQPEAVSPVYHSLRGLPYNPGQLSKLADALVSQRPARLKQMVSTLKRLKSESEIVSDREITAATKELASRGFFAEPSAAVSWAAWCKWKQKGKLRDNTAVLVLTGSGLKSWL
ncbi:MAG: pyridoxal-phosphate dependent enzyme, partial [Candidatus Bathyarchaeia archaeon]